MARTSVRTCRRRTSAGAPAAILVIALGALSVACTSTTSGQPGTATTAPASNQPSPTASVPIRSTSPDPGGPASSGSLATSSATGSITARIRLTDAGRPPTDGQLADAMAVMAERVRKIAGAEVSVEAPDVLVVTTPGTDTEQAELLKSFAVTGELLLRPVAASGPAGSDAYSPVVPPDSDRESVDSWISDATEAVTAGAVSCEDLAPRAQSPAPDLPTLACDSEQTSAYVLLGSLFEEGFVSRAQVTAPAGGAASWSVTATFDQDIAESWTEYTEQNVGAQLAFTVDGTVTSAPVINAPITTPETQLAGSFDEESAEALAAALNSGSLGLDVADVRLTTG